MPEDRADPGSRLIAVPVTVVHARSADPGEPIFRLEGGPGVSNMTFPDASRLAENHEFGFAASSFTASSIRSAATASTSAAVGFAVPVTCWAISC